MREVTRDEGRGFRCNADFPPDKDYYGNLTQEERKLEEKDAMFAEVILFKTTLVPMGKGQKMRIVIYPKKRNNSF